MRLAFYSMFKQLIIQPLMLCENTLANQRLWIHSTDFQQFWCFFQLQTLIYSCFFSSSSSSSLEDSSSHSLALCIVHLWCFKHQCCVFPLVILVLLGSLGASFFHSYLALLFALLSPFFLFLIDSSLAVSDMISFCSFRKCNPSSGAHAAFLLVYAKVIKDHPYSCYPSSK